MLCHTICSAERILEYACTVCILDISQTNSEEKSFLIPFIKVCGFHQIIDRFSEPCTVGKTQLLSFCLQLLLEDLNGFTSTVC